MDDSTNAANGAKVIKIDEGTCVRCNTDCTRRPGERWYNQYGRDECRAADEDEVEHDVPVWITREERREPPPPMVTVTLTCLDDNGRVVIAEQRLPAVPGIFWAENFPGPKRVIGWRISLDGTPER